MNLNSIFSKLISKFSDNEKLKLDYWQEIEKSYSQKNRKYHNLTHLENMILELENVKEEISDYDVLLFSTTTSFTKQLLKITRKKVRKLQKSDWKN